MKRSLNRLIESQRTGLYIGPDAVIGVTARQMLSDHNITDSIACFDGGSGGGYGLGEFHVESVRKILGTERGGVRPADGTVQVAFDDRLVRFFVLPVADKPDKAGVVRLLRWHAQKVLPGDTEYDFAARLGKSEQGYKIFGAAINKDSMAKLEAVFDAFESPWYVADSVSGFLWSHLDSEIKRHAAALVRFAHQGWTVMAWEDNGDIALVKTAKWRHEGEGRPVLQEGISEAARLLAIYADKRRQAGFKKVYVDPGGFDIESERLADVFADVFAPGGTKLLKLNEVPRRVSVTDSGYTVEFAAAYQASLPRRR